MKLLHLSLLRHGILLLIWFLLLLGASMPLRGTDSGVFDSTQGSLASSPNDTRQYRALTLANGMRVLLVSDPTADKAAAAVDIDAGSNSDPAAFPGLTHFLEHMLFLGTRDFPEAGAYQEYIAAHGGSNNAYTAYENTNYYFEIDAPYLEPALQRFAQFFTAPLFTQDYVDRERNAVHSEYQSGLQDDGRRGYSALKQILNPEHPLARFSVGSLDTLQDQAGMTLRDALLQHHARYYSANLMGLSLFGRESLDDLEALARRYFADVPNTNATPPQTVLPLFMPGSLPAQLDIEPVRDLRSLTFTFPIPPVQGRWRAKPLQYLGNVLGHEGEGSLLALLREQGWANGLSAGGGFAYRDAATFTVSVGLTEAGLVHVDDIAALLFQFLDLVRRDGVQEWLFAEQRVMADLGFRFQEPAAPVSLVSSLARRMQEPGVPLAEVLTAPYAYTSFDAPLLQSILAELRPDNVLLTLTARGVATDAVDPWYGTAYRFAALAPERVAAWRDAPRSTQLAIAAPNPFLPTDLELKPYTGVPAPAGLPNVAVKPELLVDADGVRLWFKQDDEFHTPRASFFVYALTPLFEDNLRNSLLASFAVNLVNDQLNEFAYPANLAGSFFGLASRARGFTLTVSGYSDKQELLLEELLKTLTRAQFDPERFDIIRAEMVRSWQNARLQTPYIRLFEQTQALLMDPAWSEDERIVEVQDITLEEVQAFIPQVLASLRLDVLYHGNVTPDDAQAMLDVLTRYLRPDAAAGIPGYGRVLDLPEGQRIVLEQAIDHDDSAFVLYLQGENDALHTRALLQLLGTILANPFYEALRTEQQLGYIVNAGALPILDTSGLVMYIESPGSDPLAIEAAVNAFLLDYASALEVMTPERFASIKSGLLTSLREPVQRLATLSNRYWGDIVTGRFTQDSTLQLADAIEAVTQEQVLAWYRSQVSGGGAARVAARTAGRALREQFEAARAEPATTVILEGSVEAWRGYKAGAQWYEFR
jgi:secreted Zn-dependent insulinase-like peptidase